MSYIRGALPFLIYNPNTRDDIVPDGVTSTFELSQEVPGGYEANVEVIRRELKQDPLIQDCDQISFDGTANKLLCTDAAIAAALSIINVGDSITVTGALESGNNDDLLVTNVAYNGLQIEIFVENALTDEAAGEEITLVRRYSGSWETLEPEIDYTISGIDEQFNRLINFSKIPQENDVIYVVHRGEATYNFRPTEKSVGPQQLQDNLRNFVVDHFEGDGVEDTFTLTQVAVNAKALEVSIDGLIKTGTDVDISFVGDFELSPDGLEITFASPPSLGEKIQVRHLGFSTISRRQALSPSQVGSIAPGAVGTPQLANNAVTEQKIDDGAVTKFKIAAGAVDGSRILLQNNEWLNWKSGITPMTSVGVLKVDASDLTTLRSPAGTLSINIADTRLILVGTTFIKDGTGTNQVDLGSNANKFKDGYFGGQVNANSADITDTLDVGGDATVGGNLEITGDITINGSIDNVDISDLQTQVNNLAALVASICPPGTLKLAAADEAADGSVWLDCDGSLVSTTTFAALFAKLGYIYGGSGGSFAVPDFRGRFALGKSASGTGSGMGSGASARSGSLDHTHSTPNHTHGLANHIHSIPAHYHIITPSSTLAIASSGSHTTTIDIAHSHGSSSVTGTVGGSDGTHTHALSLTTESANHSHTITISGNGEHSHFLNCSGGAGGSFGGSSSSGEIALKTGGDGTADRVTGAPGHIGGSGTTLDGAHTHTASAGNQTALHTHTPVWTGGGSGGHGHSHSLTASGQTLGLTNKTDTSGLHIHAAASFSGSIGPVDTGANGNTAFNSGPPSPNVSDSGGASVTGSNNPAFQTCRVFIKT